MKGNNSPVELAKVFEGKTSIAVASHYNPDADAYGSSLGLAHALSAWGKKVLVVNESGVIDRYKFLPGIQKIQSSFAEALGNQYDTLVCCDCGDRKRIGDSLVGKLSQFKTVINIDHHISNDYFGSLNYVDPQASSTSELILRVLEEMKQAIPKDTANCLYAGLVGDTGSFRYSNTGTVTFEVARKLTTLGANPAEIAQALFSSERKEAVKLKAHALSEMKFHADGKVAEIILTEESFKRHAATADDTEGLVESARDIEGVLAAALLYPDSQIWRVSLRSKHPEVDVSMIAQSFGGGGHKMAAGFRVKRPLPEFHDLLIKNLTEAVSRI